MTTPAAVPSSPFQVTVGNSAYQFWDGLKGAADLLLVNTDQNDNITIGPKGVQPYATNGQVILPQQSISVPAAQSWCCVTDATDNPTLQVTPGGGNYSPSALAIAEQIAQSGLALSIAEAIALQGISLIGAPVLLYSSSGSSGTSGTPGLVGATIGKKTYNAPDFITGANDFDTNVGRPMAITSQKMYFGSPPWPTQVSSDIQGLLNAGCQLCLCYSPAFNPTSATDRTNLATSINMYVAAASAAGAPEPKCALWQEADNNKNNMTAAQFGTMLSYYSATVRAIVPLVCNLSSYRGNSVQVAYATAALGLVDAIAADIYGQPDYKSGVRIDALEAFADANSLPFGVWEFGKSTGPAPDQTNVNNFLNYLQKMFVARLVAGKTNGEMMWYADGPVNEILPGDPTIPLLDNLYDAVSSVSPAPGIITVPAGGSVTLTPINPSPGGGFALANGLSYDITLTLVAGSSSTVPFCTVELNWHNIDQQGATSVAQQNWRVPMGTNGGPGTIITGVGPQHGQYLAITIYNKDTVTCTVEVQVNSTSRSVARHDWRWDAISSASVPTYTLPGGGGYGNSLGSINGTAIGAGNSKSWLLSLFAGEVFIRFGETGASNADNVEVILAPQPSSVWGSDALIKENPPFEDTIILPRGPCLVTFTNNDGSSIDAFIEAVALD